MTLLSLSFSGYSQASRSPSIFISTPQTTAASSSRREERCVWSHRNCQDQSSPSPPYSCPSRTFSHRL